MHLVRCRDFSNKVVLQVEGINRLIRVMQEVRDNDARRGPRVQRTNRALPTEVQEAIQMLQWFVNEVQSLSPYARGEAMR